MAKKAEAVDNLLDALVWMRRKTKRNEAVDDLIDALMKMRRKTKKKLAKRKRSKIGDGHTAAGILRRPYATLAALWKARGNYAALVERSRISASQKS